jgi:hypothetical protein
MDLSLGKLQQLITVARCGSFSRAAEELPMTQPALSRSIAAIERRYGFAIFNRIGHGVEPTAAAAQVLSYRPQGKIRVKIGLARLCSGFTATNLCRRPHRASASLAASADPAGAIRS